MATEDAFQKFLRNQNTKAEQLGNLSDTKAAWLRQVDNLYEQVLRLLSPHVRSGDIKQETQPYSVYEELLGTYEVPSLILNLGTSKVQFKPIGTYLLGTPGRVDMVGLRSSIRMVLTTRDASEPVLRFSTISGPQPEKLTPKINIADYVWKISTNPPRIKYSDITLASLEKAIIEVVNG